MALTTIPSELSSVSGIADSSDATAITIDSSENVTFAGNILKTGDLTLDVSGDIILDAGGADIKLHDDGTEFGKIYKSSNNLHIWSAISDGDIRLQGNDGGSTITALTLDMSEGGNVGLKTTTPLMPLHIAGTSTNALLFDPSYGTISNNVYFTGSAWDSFNHSATGAALSIGGSGDFSFRRATAADPPVLTYSMYIATDGDVGIGTTSPAGLLHLSSSSEGRDLKFILANSPATGNVGVQLRGGSGDYIGIAADGTGVGIVVKSDNKIGIGELNPSSALHIVESHTTNVTTYGELVSGTSFTINGDSSEGSDVLRLGAMANGTGDYFIDVSNNTGASTYNLLVNPFGGGLGVGTTSLTNSHMLKLKSVAGQSPLVELINSDSEDSDTGREASIRFSGFRSGGESTINAQISGHHLGSGDDDKGGLIFWHNNGSGSLSEAMRINEWGRLGIGTGSDAPTSAIHVKGTSNNWNSHILHVHRPDGLGHASEPFSEILIQNQESTNGYQYGGMTMMADFQTHLRFQVGNSDSWGGTGAKRWQIRVGEGAGTDKLSVYSWTAAQEVLEISSSGTLTASSTSTNYAFHAGNGSGKVGMGALNSSYYHWVRQSGPTSWYFSQATYADGGFHTYSDERLKKDITVISNAVDAVKKMRGVTFNWKVTEDRGREGKQFGCIAQDLLKVDENLPELMIDPLAKAGEEESTDKLYTLDYSRITPYLIEAIKEQQTLIETLQTKVAALEAK